MGVMRWGSDPELFGPRHAHREARILRALGGRESEPGFGLHLECAAGLGSLSLAIAAAGRTVVAADRSLRSLVELQRRAGRPETGSGSAAVQTRVLPVVADITALPFAEQTFASASSAETLEHVEDHAAAVAGLCRALIIGARLVGTVPAEGKGWQEWDHWAGHLRRYSCADVEHLLEAAGFEPAVTRWGWPLVWLYDRLFLRRLNHQRLVTETADAGSKARSLRVAAALGRRRWLVRLVRCMLDLDRPLDGLPWGVGVLFVARRVCEPGNS